MYSIVLATALAAGAAGPDCPLGGPVVYSGYAAPVYYAPSAPVVYGPVCSPVLSYPTVVYPTVVYPAVVHSTVVYPTVVHSGPIRVFPPCGVYYPPLISPGGMPKVIEKLGPPRETEKKGPEKTDEGKPKIEKKEPAKPKLLDDDEVDLPAPRAVDADAEEELPTPALARPALSERDLGLRLDPAPKADGYDSGLTLRRDGAGRVCGFRLSGVSVTLR